MKLHAMFTLFYVPIMVYVFTIQSSCTVIHLRFEYDIKNIKITSAKLSNQIHVAHHYVDSLVSVPLVSTIIAVE